MPVPIKQAARSLRRSRRTIERWLAQGAPHVVVRGRRLVDVAELRRWRDGDVSDSVDALARTIEWALRRDAGHGSPTWRALGVPEDRAIALLLLVFDKFAQEVGNSSGELPAALRQAMSRLLYLRQTKARSRTT